MDKKLCRYCQQWYSEDSFNVAATREHKVYRRRKCKHCYRTTKQELIQRCYQWLVEYKEERGCYKCGIRDHRVLDLHHKNEQEKEFSISSFRRSVAFERVKSEVKKCAVICANCHRILHSEQREPKL